MGTKEDILLLLEKNRGQSISGQLMAENLNISRAAIWKNIKVLEQEGHLIEASTKVGYKLVDNSDILSASGINAILEKEGVYNQKIIYYRSIDSTNKEAKRLILDNLEHTAVVVSDHQTAGLGRNGKSFFSPSGSGLYLSMVLKPKIEPTVALRVTSAAAVATCRAIEEATSIKAKIKWVNDIYIDKLKVAGILTEGISGFESRRIESIVVGIGLNFREPDEGFPTELKNVATSLFPKGQAVTTSRNEIAAKLIIHLLSLTNNLDDNSYIEEYRNRSMVLHKDLFVITPNSRYQAFVKHIDDNGALVVVLEDGTKQLLQSGEISLRFD